MEPENDGLEDDFPFQLGGFLGSMLIFRGVCKTVIGRFEGFCLTSGSGKLPLQMDRVTEGLFTWTLSIPPPVATPKTIRQRWTVLLANQSGK